MDLENYIPVLKSATEEWVRNWYKANMSPDLEAKINAEYDVAFSRGERARTTSNLIRRSRPET